MKKMCVISAALAALALSAAPVLVQDALAEVAFSATVRTPNVSISIGNIPTVYGGSYRVGYLPARSYMRYRIAERDRLIAGRLSWYTGVPAGELIRLRAYGYNWFEIGTWLRLPKAVVKASFNERKWDRFAYAGRHPGGHGPAHGKPHKVIVYNR
jgi:hypothetical protein